MCQGGKEGDLLATPDFWLTPEFSSSKGASPLPSSLGRMTWPQLTICQRVFGVNSAKIGKSSVSLLSSPPLKLRPFSLPKKVSCRRPSQNGRYGHLYFCCWSVFTSVSFSVPSTTSIYSKLHITSWLKNQVLAKWFSSYFLQDNCVLSWKFGSQY